MCVSEKMDDNHCSPGKASYLYINFGHAVISLDLQGVVEKIESGLKGETNGWKSRAGWFNIAVRQDAYASRSVHVRRTSAFFPSPKSV